ncbi:MAG: hypothetical protein J6S85_21860 [Methanobrevibacter sp.]|nr:hypothetical protein [Methanobrevibacter sp.]
MEYYYDIFVKYNDEKEERVIARELTSGQMYALFNHLLRERKHHYENNLPKTHYPEYIRVE